MCRIERHVWKLKYHLLFNMWQSSASVLSVHLQFMHFILCWHWDLLKAWQQILVQIENFFFFFLQGWDGKTLKKLIIEFNLKFGRKVMNFYNYFLFFLLLFQFFFFNLKWKNKINRLIYLSRNQFEIFQTTI